MIEFDSTAVAVALRPYMRTENAFMTLYHEDCQ